MKLYKIILFHVLFVGTICGQEVNPTVEICTGNERLITNMVSEQVVNTVPPTTVVDTDNDGLDDSLELEGDCDGDGLDNINDPDSDNDGFIDGIDPCVCEPASANSGCPYDKRFIFFTHGFQGNEQSWNLQENWVNEFFPGARPESIVYTNDQNSLDGAANRMRDFIEDEVALHQSLSDPNKANFLIAHSMGGIVARNSFATFNNYDEFPLGGFVTFGSAHRGVGAANTRVNNPAAYTEVVHEACEALGLDILQETFSLDEEGFAIRDYVLLSLEWLNEEALCDKLSPLAFSTVESSWSQPIEEELTTADSENWPASPTIHNVAFYGVEPDEALVTIEPYDGESYEVTINSVMTPKFAGGIIAKAGDLPIWQADVLDDVGIEKFAMNLALLEHRKQSLEEQKNAAHVALNLCIVFYPPCIIPSLALLYSIGENQNANYRAFQFMDNINGLWRNIIQADRLETIETGVQCLCTSSNGLEIFSDLVDGGCDIPIFGFDCEIVTGQSLISISEDSDGFITESSAMNMPSATYPPQIMLGSSHFQMRNDDNARNAFYTLLKAEEEDLFFWFKSDE